MNLIPVLMNELKLKMEEEFLIYKNGGGYGKRSRFRQKDSKYLLEDYDFLRKVWETCSAEELGRLVLGIDIIKKLPFRPNFGENYFYVDWEPFGSDGYKKIEVYERKFVGNSRDYFNIILDDVFGTYDDAAREKYNVYKKIMSKVDLLSKE